MAYSGDSSRITALNQVYRYRRRSPLGGHTRAGELANAWLEAQYELGCTIQEREGHQMSVAAPCFFPNLRRREVNFPHASPSPCRKASATCSEVGSISALQPPVSVSMPCRSTGCIRKWLKKNLKLLGSRSPAATASFAAWIPPIYKPEPNGRAPASWGSAWIMTTDRPPSSPPRYSLLSLKASKPGTISSIYRGGRGNQKACRVKR